MSARDYLLIGSVIGVAIGALLTVVVIGAVQIAATRQRIRKRRRFIVGEQGPEPILPVGRGPSARSFQHD